MTIPNTDTSIRTQLQQVMNYTADLELELHRLRRRDQFLQQEALERVRQIASLCTCTEQCDDMAGALAAIMEACELFDNLLRDLRDPPGYIASFDQVIAIAVGPLAEQVFRGQQRLTGASRAVLHLDLQPDSINWFPARLRHILENLISNALRYRDPNKGESRVGLHLRIVDEGYELRFTDNGLGIPGEKVAGMLDLLSRAAPTRVTGLGVGLAVAKLLAEQSCGTLSISSGEGRGTSVTVVLPRYNLDDYID